MLKFANGSVPSLELLNGPIFFVVMCVLMLISLEIGRLIRSLSTGKRSVTTLSLSGPVETIIFAVLGLLIAFTFTGAGNRFEARRQLIGAEAGIIKTAY